MSKILDVNKNISADLDELIKSDLISKSKNEMKVSQRYYDKQHDILNYRLFYIDNDGVAKEEKNRSNVKIPHPFHNELVDQKVNYLLSDPIAITSKNEDLNALLKQYIDADFQLTIQELVEGASIKGFEGLYFYYDKSGRIRFETVDSYHLIFINDKDGELEQIVRYYNVHATVNSKQEIITKAEVYDTEKVTYYVKKDKRFKLDESIEMNPKLHKVIKVDDVLYQPAKGRLPFLLLENNRQKTTDLHGIKELIDDFDLHASALTNNLKDNDFPIYAIKGYGGDSFDDLINNVQARKAISLDEDGSFDVKTVDVPFEARKAKLEITKEAIYKFGLGFDSTAQAGGDRALTNIGIQSRYSLLNIKANKIESRLRKLLDQILELIVENIKELTGREYDVIDTEIEISRTVLTNDKEVAEQESLKATAKLNRINAIMNASLTLGSEIVTKLLADELGFDADEALNAMIENNEPILNIGLSELNET